MDSNNQEGDGLSDCKLRCESTQPVEGFIRQDLPEREYDLQPLDPTKPSIHVLNNDVLMNIFKYLDLTKKISCEIVCRRWQGLVYLIFRSTTHLEFNEDFCIKNSLIYVSEAMVAKMLILTGETLISLSCLENYISNYNCDYKKLLFLIAQYCPKIEYLHLSRLQNLYSDNAFSVMGLNATYENLIGFKATYGNVKTLKDCKSLKCFSATGCYQLNENAFKELILALPLLEKINVSNTAIKGHCFDHLPMGLKELNISHCRDVSEENLRKLSRACKHLEVLEIEELEYDKKILEEIGINCTNLKTLKLGNEVGINCTNLITLKLGYNYYFPDVSNQIKVFTNLTSLKILANEFELPNIADNLKELEELHLKIIDKKINIIDFSKFTRLKKVILEYVDSICKQELLSLGNCSNLQDVTIQNGDQIDQQTIITIVKGCSEIKLIQCPDLSIDTKFINDINEIMKERSEPIKIRVKCSTTTKDLLDVQYDTTKMELDFIDDDDDDANNDYNDDGDYDNDDYDYEDYDDYVYDNYASVYYNNQRFQGRYDDADDYDSIFLGNDGDTDEPLWG